MRNFSRTCCHLMHQLTQMTCFLLDYCATNQTLLSFCALRVTAPIDMKIRATLSSCHPLCWLDTAMSVWFYSFQNILSTQVIAESSCGGSWSKHQSLITERLSPALFHTRWNTFGCIVDAKRSFTLPETKRNWRHCACCIQEGLDSLLHNTADHKGNDLERFCISRLRLGERMATWWRERQQSNGGRKRSSRKSPQTKWGSRTKQSGATVMVGCMSAWMERKPFTLGECVSLCLCVSLLPLAFATFQGHIKISKQKNQPRCSEIYYIYVNDPLNTAKTSGGAMLLSQHYALIMAD